MSVTSVTGETANGLVVTVADPTTTPQITVGTNVTGMAKANGTGFVSAVSGTDYAPATTGSSILKASSGAFANAVAGTDYVAPGGALGEPSSGNLANCTALPLTGLTGTGVAWVPAPTGNATTDTTNIQNAINSLGTAGGDVNLQGSYYELTATGITIANPIRLRGVGAWGPAGYPIYGTWLYSNSATATAITVTAGGVVIENILIANSAGATSGYGIQVTGASASSPSTVYIHRCNIDNYYDAIVFANACEFSTIASCEIINPVRYGIHIANSDNVDMGDNIILDTKVITTPSATSAIRWESGGGLRILGCKLLGAFTTAVDIALAGGANTSNIFVHNNSMEAITGTGVKLWQQSAGSGSVGNIQILGNEFLGTSLTPCVDWGEGFSNGIIADNVASTAGTGITLENGSGGLTIGQNSWSGITTVIDAISGATADLQLLPQHVVNGNTLETTTVTTGGTTTLSINSTPIQIFTGSDLQTVLLPTTSVAAGMSWTIINQSTDAVTVESSGSNSILVLPGVSSAPYNAALFTAVAATPTTAANWVCLSYLPSGGALSTGNVIPASNNNYNLGSLSSFWQNLYVTSAYAYLLNLYNSTTGYECTLESNASAPGAQTLILPATATADTLVGRASTDTLTNKRITNRVSTTNAPGATPSMDTDNYDLFKFTGLTAAITSMTANLTGTPNDGDQLSIRFTDNGTARAITWGSKFLSSGSQALLATTVAGKSHLVRFVWDATASAWVCWYVDATGYTA